MFEEKRESKCLFKRWVILRLSFWKLRRITTPFLLAPGDLDNVWNFLNCWLKAIQISSSLIFLQHYWPALYHPWCSLILCFPALLPFWPVSSLPLAPFPEGFWGPSQSQCSPCCMVVGHLSGSAQEWHLLISAGLFSVIFILPQQGAFDTITFFKVLKED